MLSKLTATLEALTAAGQWRTANVTTPVAPTADWALLMSRRSACIANRERNGWTITCNGASFVTLHSADGRRRLTLAYQPA